MPPPRRTATPRREGRGREWCRRDTSAGRSLRSARGTGRAAPRRPAGAGCACRAARAPGRTARRAPSGASNGFSYRSSRRDRMLVPNGHAVRAGIMGPRMSTGPVTIGRYQVRDRLGQGGMGVLYLALDPAIDRLVALKVLRVDNEEMRERFLREARLAARLQHPNIVTIYDVGSHEGQPFIAM